MIGTRYFVNSSLNKESVLTDRKLDDSGRITLWLESLGRYAGQVAANNRVFAEKYVFMSEIW